MAENKNTLELKILDTDFTVKVTSESQRQKLIEIETYVDQELMRIKEKNPFINHIRIAILGCMNITEQLFELQGKVGQIEAQRQKESDYYKSLNDQVKALKDDQANLKKGYEDQIERLNQKLAELADNQSIVDRQIAEKNELLNQYREKLTQSKNENDLNRKSILDLQNQLFENQIELVKLSRAAQSPALDDEEAIGEMEDAQLSDIIRVLKAQENKKA